MGGGAVGSRAPHDVGDAGGEGEWPRRWGDLKDREVNRATPVSAGVAVRTSGGKQQLRSNGVLQRAIEGCPPPMKAGRRRKAAAAVVLARGACCAYSKNMLAVAGGTAPGFRSEGNDPSAVGRWIAVLFLSGGPLKGDSILGGAEVGRVMGVPRVTHRDVEVKTFEFGEAGDGDVEVRFREWGGETRGVDFLAHCASCFFEDVAP